jgi:hypothetical protein
MIGPEEADKIKPVISKKDWNDKLNTNKLSKQDLNKLIMNFFLVEGYKEAAENFREESATDISTMDLTFMQERLEIRSMIHEGNIDKAMTKVNELDPKILDVNADLLFTLRLQKLIELIKQNKVVEAIEYAQRDLAPFMEKNDKYAESVEKVMSLLAFEDMNKSKMSDLIENSQKIKVASEVNHELLRSKQKETDSKLTTLLKLCLWSQSRLKDKVTFPSLNSLTGLDFCKTNNLE